MDANQRTIGSIASRGRRSQEFRAIGTTIQVVVDDAEVLDYATELVLAQIVALDLAVSRFRDDRELTQLNARQGWDGDGGASSTSKNRSSA